MAETGTDFQRHRVKLIVATQGWSGLDGGYGAGNSPSALYPFAGLHDVVDLERVPDVDQGIGIEHDQIGDLAGLERTEVGLADRRHQPGPGSGCGHEHLHRRQPGLDVEFEFVMGPQPIGTFPVPLSVPRASLTPAS